MSVVILVLFDFEVSFVLDNNGGLLCELSRGCFGDLHALDRTLDKVFITGHP